jgi:hypothetical protein
MVGANSILSAQTLPLFPKTSSSSLVIDYIGNQNGISRFIRRLHGRKSCHMERLQETNSKAIILVLVNVLRLP